MNNYNKIRKEQFQIRSYEIDPSGKITIQSICNYLQEIASNHAYELVVSVHTLFKQKLTWVLSRLHLQMKEYLRWSEKIIIETWPVETIPIDIWQNFRLDLLEASFRAESKFGNQILSRAHQTKNSNQYIFLHNLSLESDNTELAILKTKWIVNQKK